MTEIQQRLDDLDIVELSTRERSSTKWMLLFTTNVTIFTALLKSVPVGCKDILLPPNLVKRSDVNCLTYKSNCLTYKSLTVFDFESVCVKNSKLVDTETTTWVGKHEPISVYITSNLLKESLFICNTEPYSLVSAFVNSVESLAEKKKLEMDLKFHDVATRIKE